MVAPNRIRTGRRWRLTVGSLIVAVAALAVIFAVIRATMAPYWAAMDVVRRSGNGHLMPQWQAKSAVKDESNHWQVRIVDKVQQREFIITLTDEEVRKARILPW